MLKNNCVLPSATGGTHWLEYLPDHLYCFLPSFEADKGKVEVYDYMPTFVKDFLFSIQIEQVRKRKSNGNFQNKFKLKVSKLPPELSVDVNLSSEFPSIRKEKVFNLMVSK